MTSNNTPPLLLSEPDSQQITWLDDMTPHSLHYQDIYFSQHGGLPEKQHVFIEGSQLMSRFIAHSQAEFTILETGFGTGLNYLAAWQTFIEFKQKYPNNPLNSLRFISIEAHPLTVASLQRIHQRWPSLQPLAAQLYQYWPTQFKRIQTCCFGQQVSLTLWVDDIQTLLKQTNLAPDLTVDCWFLDGFSPAKNPDMWCAALFDFMAQHAKSGSHVATYTTARLVRDHLQRVGFVLQKRPGFANKREMLTAVFQANDS